MQEQTRARLVRVNMRGGGGVGVAPFGQPSITHPSLPFHLWSAAIIGAT